MKANNIATGRVSKNKIIGHVRATVLNGMKKPK
jgi:hypothetical protein